MTDFLTIIKDVGVPTGIALLVLLRIEPKLEKMNATLLELPEKLHNVINSHDPEHKTHDLSQTGGT